MKAPTEPFRFRTHVVFTQNFRGLLQDFVNSVRAYPFMVVNSDRSIEKEFEVDDVARWLVQPMSKDQGTRSPMMICMVRSFSAQTGPGFCPLIIFRLFRVTIVRA